MISGKTKRIAVIAGVTFVGMIAVVFLAIQLILSESTKLGGQVEAIVLDRAQQVAFSRLQRLVSETEGERKELQSYYLTSQSDSIDFLNYIEQLASDRGVQLGTINPTEEIKDKQTYLSVGYQIQGSLAQVEDFIKLLETIPYVSQLMSVKLAQQSPVIWQANVMIDVAIVNYES